MHRGILLLIQSWFWLIYLALYEQPGRYISNVRDRFVVREISGYRQRVIGSWMQDGYLKSSKVWLIQGFRCVLPLISKTLFPWHKSRVHLLSRYPVILSGKPWCYLVFYFKYQCGSTDFYTSVAQEHLRLDALPDSTVFCQESNTGPLSLWKTHALAIILSSPRVYLCTELQNLEIAHVICLPIYHFILFLVQCAIHHSSHVTQWWRWWKMQDRFAVLWLTSSFYCLFTLSS